MKQSYKDCINRLNEFKESLLAEDDIKRGRLYFSWIENKTNKILNEKDKKYVYTQLVNYTLQNYKINNYLYNKSNGDLKQIIKDNYSYDGKTYSFSNKNISYEEAMLLAKYIILKRGNVIWVDFGFNIGNEFGGMHPAIILKNFDNELFVLPVSSKMPTEYKRIEADYQANKITIEESKKQKEDITEIIQLNKIYGFKSIIRYGNITRIRKVSILRLNFSGSIGAISGEDINNISEKIRREFSA